MVNIFFFLATGVIAQSQRINEHLSRRTHQEFEVFILQLENELQGREYLNCTDHEIILRAPSGASTFINIRNHIIRKVENNGYQPLLTQVEKVYFQEIEQRVLIRVTFLNGEVYEGYWILPQT